MATAVTDRVPVTSARMPNCSCTCDVGRQFGLVKNSLRFRCPSTGAPSTKTNTKIASTKKIALHPKIRISHSITGSPVSIALDQSRRVRVKPPLPFRRESPTVWLVLGVMVIIRGVGARCALLLERHVPDVPDDLLTF